MPDTRVYLGTAFKHEANILPTELPHLVAVFDMTHITRNPVSCIDKLISVFVLYFLYSNIKTQIVHVIAMSGLSYLRPLKTGFLMTILK